MELPALLLVGPDGQVIAMNPVARLILQEGDGLQVEDNCLRLPDWGDDRKGLLTIDRPSGRPPWRLSITKLMNGSADVFYRAITICDTSRCEESARALLNEVYRFTKAEKRLVDQLLAGRTPAEAAEALGVSIHTVRTYQKRLYGKVGVHNQAALVRALMLALPPYLLASQSAV